MNETLTFPIKRLSFKGKRVPIVVQSVNGPCPLLAVANILSLRGQFNIHEDKAVVTADDLLTAVSNYLLDANVTKNAEMQNNYERNVHDVIQMLPNTLIGIDVNLKFDRIGSFEYTAESILFDFCNVRLVHGWLIDPQDVASSHLRTMSYNQLVEKKLAIDATVEKMKKMSLQDTNKDETNKETDNTSTENTDNQTNTAPKSPETIPQNGNDEDKLALGYITEKFLNETASQLTYYGLAELHSGLQDEELCIFFRNNHFNVLYKRNKELFILVTDQGYRDTPVVWEKLCQIDGDSVFLTSEFTPYQATSPVFEHPTTEPAIVDAEMEKRDYDRDYALALQLQEEAQAESAPSQPSQPRKERKTDKEKASSCSIQ